MGSVRVNASRSSSACRARHESEGATRLCPNHGALSADQLAQRAQIFTVKKRMSTAFE